MSTSRVGLLACCAALAAASACSLEKSEKLLCSVENPECPGDLVCDGERCVERSAPPPDRGLPPDRGAPDQGAPDTGVPDQAVPDVAPPDAPPADIAAPDGPLPDVAPPDLPPPDLPPADAAPPDTGCTPGTTTACYTGPPGTAGVGACVEGQSTCEATGEWGPCYGQVLPMSEICDGKDNDCNGSADVGCQCILGESQDCGTDVGECVKGTQACQANGTWGACSDVGPSPEQCDNLDHNCNGDPYDGFACVPQTCHYFLNCGAYCPAAGMHRTCTSACILGPCQCGGCG